MDALQASLQAPTPAVRLKVAALLRILISSKDRDVISLVLASGCNRLFSQVLMLLQYLVAIEGFSVTDDIRSHLIKTWITLL